MIGLRSAAPDRVDSPAMVRSSNCSQGIAAARRGESVAASTQGTDGLVVTPMRGRLSASAPLAVLVLLAAGRTVAQTADVTTWSRRRVVELARHIGWVYDTDADRVVRPAAAVAS
jgi:hypothetical protein